MDILVPAMEDERCSAGLQTVMPGGHDAAALMDDEGAATSNFRSAIAGVLPLRCLTLMRQ